MKQVRSEKCHWRAGVVLEPECGSGTSLHGGYCKGAHELFKNVESLGSLFAAAKEMGMAYSKAWRLVHDVEDDFGVQLLDTQGPAGSVVTCEGKRLMSNYEAALEALERAKNEWVESGHAQILQDCG